MRLRELTSEEIKKFASRAKVRKVAAENFLMSMGNNYEEAMGNLSLDTELYKWNSPTVKAIRDGIMLAARGG